MVIRPYLILSSPILLDHFWQIGVTVNSSNGPDLTIDGDHRLKVAPDNPGIKSLYQGDACQTCQPWTFVDYQSNRVIMALMSSWVQSWPQIAPSLEAFTKGPPPLPPSHVARAAVLYSLGNCIERESNPQPFGQHTGNADPKRHNGTVNPLYHSAAFQSPSVPSDVL